MHLWVFSGKRPRGFAFRMQRVFLYHLDTRIILRIAESVYEHELALILIMMVFWLFRSVS